MFGRRRFRKGMFLLWVGSLMLILRGGTKVLDYYGAGHVLRNPRSLFMVTVSEGDVGMDLGMDLPSLQALESEHFEHFGSSRRLLSMPNCTPRAVEQFPRDFFTQTERVQGALIIHILVVIYMFLALALVCDNYFVPSLEVLSELLHLQTDVAGATFMAAGSSAPELATAVIGVFVAQDDVGLSTVVGSAIYNVMFVISVCGLAAPMAVQLNWWPLVRDCVAYLMSIGALIFAIFDETIRWYESVLFLVLYGLYIVVMYFNQPLEHWFNSHCTCFPKEATTAPDQVIVHYEKTLNGEGPHHETTILSPKGRHNTGSSDSLSSVEEAATEIHKIAPEDSIWTRPSGFCSSLLWAVSLPLTIIMYITVPDCRKDSLRKCFLLTFIMSLVWLSVFSFLMVWMITIIGYTVDIPDSVMSLTFVAFGVSLPDVVASVIVIKDGLGDMAVSNAVGSNVFDILVCLGIPWMLKTCILNPGDTIQVYSEGLVYSSITLLSTVALLLATIHLNKWKLDKKVAVLFMIVYILYSILASMYELNVFGYFHPDECPSNY